MKSDWLSLRHTCFFSGLFPLMVHFSDLQFGRNSLATNTYSVEKLIYFHFNLLEGFFFFSKEMTRNGAVCGEVSRFKKCFVLF